MTTINSNTASIGNDPYQAYLQCVQMDNEPVLQYSYRYQLLSARLGYMDNDPRVVQRYMDGLSSPIQLQLMKHKRTMRAGTFASTWEFTSLVCVINLALTVDTSVNTYSKTTTTTGKRKLLKECKHHPHSATHTTQECRHQSKKLRPNLK